MATDWEGVLKFQRSLATSLPHEQCLIYSENQDIYVQENMQPGVKKWFTGDEPKFYAKVEIADGKMTIKHKVEEQSW